MSKHPRRDRDAAQAGRGPTPAPVEDRPAGWWWLVVPVVAVTLVAFAPALDGGFVDIDDEEGFLRNRGFRGVGWSQLAWGATARTLGVYQPVAWWIAGVDYACFGLDARGIHLSSWLLHAATAGALFFLIRALLWRTLRPGDPAGSRRAAIAAALATAAFAAHPLRAIVVAWGTDMGYPPCALFAVLSLLAYLRAVDAPRRGPYLAWLAASILAYAASLGAHATMMTLPAVLLILDAYPLGRVGVGGFTRWARLLGEKLPFAALAASSAGLAVWARFGGEGVASLDRVGLSDRLANACYSLGFYVVKTALPTSLRAIYPMPARFDWLEPRFGLAALGVVGFAALAVAWRRRPWIAAAGACYLLILLPNTGLVRNISVLVSDHYSYLATIPLFVVAAAGLDAALARAGRRPGGAAAVVAGGVAVVVALAAQGRALARTWHDPVAVWARCVAANPTPDAYFQVRLGRALLDAGRPAEARAALERALEIAPDSPLAHNKLGLVLIAQGKPAEAAREFAAAARIEPTYVEARINNGYSLAQAGQVDAAGEEFAAATRLQPGLVEAQANLGAVRSRQGRYAEAAAAFDREVALDPARPEARTNLGYALIHLDRCAEAADQFAGAILLRPDDAGAHHNLGHCLARLGRREEAASEYREALRLDPRMDESRRGLAELTHGRPGAGPLRR